MTVRESSDLMRRLLATYPAQRQRMSPEDVEAMTVAYYSGLGDLAVDVVKAAIERLVRTAKFIPTIAEIREAAGIVHHGTQSSGMTAWGAVHRALRNEGQHRSPGVDFVFRDPITAQVVAAIGWFDMCASTNQDSLRARFIDAYEQLAKAERVEAQVTPGGASKLLRRADEARQLGDLVTPLLPEGDR